MNQENRNPDEMRAEYDFRGGVRGKYLERYRQGTHIVITVNFEESKFVAKSTSSARDDEAAFSAQMLDVITRPASYPPPYPSPKVQLGGAGPVTVHAGEDTSR